jgi:hypothetical protein
MLIPSSLSQVAQTVINAIDSNATLSAAGLGANNQFGAVVISPKGAPFEVLKVNSKNWKSILGKPWHPSVGAKADSLRQLGDAVVASDGRVVRVVASDASFPVIQAHNLVEVDEKTASTESYGGQVVALGTAWAAFYVVDGDSARVRSISIVKDDINETMTIKVTEDGINGDVELESWVVSLSVDVVDDIGSSMFIETLINRSSVINVALRSGAVYAEVNDLEASFTKPEAGGEITATDMVKALEVLHYSMEYLTAYVAMGLYDSTYLATLALFSTERLVDCFADLEPASTYASALAASLDLGINNYHVSLYHFPFIANDPYYDGRALWGLSGAAFAAKAKGRDITTGTTVGTHYSPAGVDLATISRANLTQVKGVGIPDYSAMVTARINKIGVSGGRLFIDDAITMWAKNDYLRFQHVGSVCDQFSKLFYAGANALRHKPDNITKKGLTRLLKSIGDSFVASGALVPPRYPETDGTSEYWFEVEQTEFDLWTCTWGLCVTGTNRRTSGEPVLIK